jgi:hypothetical protein
LIFLDPLPIRKAIHKRGRCVKGEKYMGRNKKYTEGRKMGDCIYLIRFI